MSKQYIDFKNSTETNLEGTFKFHFIPLKWFEFNHKVLSHFQLRQSVCFYEEFHDDEDFSHMKNNKWIKTKNNLISLKEVKMISKESNNMISYKQIKSNNSILEDLPLGVSIRLLIQRKVYSFSDERFPARLKIDEVEYPDGELETIYTFSLTVPKQMLDLFQNFIKKRIRFDQSVPVRSKILQYLYKFQPSVYKVLEERLMIDSTQYYTSNHLNIFEKYHPQSVLFSKWKEPFDSLARDIRKQVLHNLGCSTREFKATFANKSQNRKVRDVISRYILYSPKTKLSIEKRLDWDASEFVDFNEMLIKDDLRKKFKENNGMITGFSLPTIYGPPVVEFFSYPTNFTELESIFEKEIASGFVRLCEETILKSYQNHPDNL